MLAPGYDVDLLVNHVSPATCVKAIVPYALIDGMAMTYSCLGIIVVIGCRSIVECAARIVQEHVEDLAFCLCTYIILRICSRN